MKKVVNPKLTRDEKVTWMARWAVDHRCMLDLEGECGFCRQCVGIIAEGNFPDYQWCDKNTGERIDKNGNVWAPPNAYRKHACVAVLGRGEEAEDQLYQWLRWFETHHFILQVSDTDPADYAHLREIGILLGRHKQVRMVRTPR